MSVLGVGFYQIGKVCLKCDLHSSSVYMHVCFFFIIIHLTAGVTTEGSVIQKVQHSILNCTFVHVT